MAKTTTKAERRADIDKLRFDDAIREHADKLRDAWTSADGPRRPLSRAYELLHPTNVRQAIVQWCIDFARTHDHGTISNPTNERRVAQLYREGKIDLPELSSLRQFLNSWTLAALSQGHFAARGLEPDAVATGTRRAIAADRWQNLQPDFKQGAASVDGKPIVYGIEVEIAQSATAPPTRRNVSQADLKNWYVDTWIPSCRAEGRIPTRDGDFAAAKVHFDGGSFDRDWLRDLRPLDWSRRGKRPAPKLAGKIGG